MKREPVDRPILAEERNTIDQHQMMLKAPHEEAIEDICDDTRYRLSSPELWEDLVSIEDGKKTCRICSRTFSQLYNLKRHIQGVHGPPVFKCPMCPMAFKLNYKLGKHLQTHQDPPSCVKILNSNVSDLKNKLSRSEVGNLSGSNRRKLTTAKYPCETCGRAFRSPQNRECHIIIIHGGDSQCTKKLTKSETVQPLHLLDYNRNVLTTKRNLNVICEADTPFTQTACKENIKPTSQSEHLTVLTTPDLENETEDCNLNYSSELKSSNNSKTHVNADSSDPKVQKVAVNGVSSDSNMLPIQDVIKQEPIQEYDTTAFAGLTPVLNQNEELEVEDGTLHESSTVCTKDKNCDIDPKEWQEFASTRGSMNACLICNQTFNKLPSLKTHFKNVHGPDHFRCPICFVTFKKNHLLNRHVITCHVTLPNEDGSENSGLQTKTLVSQQVSNYCCETCGQKFCSQQNLRVHVAHKHEITNQDSEFPKEHELEVQEQLCESDTNEPENLTKNNITSEEPVTPASCKEDLEPSSPNTDSEKELDEKLTSKSSTENGTETSKPIFKELKSKKRLSETSSKIPNKKPHFQCHKCKNDFENEGAFRSHTTFCSLEWKCEVCGYIFEKKKMLQNHVYKVHEASKVCEKCGKSIRNMKEHMKRMHVEDNVHKCSYCPRSYYDKYKLVVHERSHTGERPYQCEMCGKRFASEDQLKVHHTSHKTEKLWLCEICGKTFHNRSVLCNHQNLHKEKAFACEICGKTFGQKEKLKRHLTVHTGEQPYSCRFCEKKFARYNNMILHVRIHTNERPYACGICGKTFYNASNRKTHIRSHLRC